jgi:NAD(P)-dependent dehydrogenase (short-subunit alcohol dehydrogenase family)
VREGARVVGADILDDEGTALAARLTAAGPGSMEYRHLDVSSEAQWAELAAFLSAHAPSPGGALHGLVNNAGIPYRARLADMDLPGWERVTGVNLTGTMLGMRTLAPLMPDHDGASIVNIGSIAGGSRPTRRPGRAGARGGRRGGVPAVGPRVLPQRGGDPRGRRPHRARRRQVHHRRSRPFRWLTPPPASA